MQQKLKCANKLTLNLSSKVEIQRSGGIPRTSNLTSTNTTHAGEQPAGFFY